MKAVIQRVSEASVTINQDVNHPSKEQIGQGLLVLVGIENEDATEDIEWLAKKITAMRIFADENGIMNRSVKEIGGEILVVSQFTLHASTKKGNRPSYVKAAKPDSALPVYNAFLQYLEYIFDKPVKKGVFGANMNVRLCNDGPVTILIDSKRKE